MTSRDSSEDPPYVPETQPLPSPPPSPKKANGRSSPVDLCSRSQSPADLGQSALGQSSLHLGFAVHAEPANRKYRWSSPAETQQQPEAQDMETCVHGNCDICDKTFESVVSPPPRICPRCLEKSKNAQVKTEKGKGKEESKEEESTGLLEYTKLRRAAVKKHALERLPDLDSTVPWSHEITVGRPLSQSEKDRVNVLFGGAATNRTPPPKLGVDSDDDGPPLPNIKTRGGSGGSASKKRKMPEPSQAASARTGPMAPPSSAPTAFSLNDLLSMCREHIDRR